MERANFQAIEKNGSYNLKNKNCTIKKAKSFIVLKCFLIHQEKYTWGMLEIIL